MGYRDARVAVVMITHNRRDEALILYPSLVRSDHHRALGRAGLSNADLRKLGPLAARYEEHDIHEILGAEHTLLDAVANPRIARWIAPYAWAPDPGPRQVREYAGTNDVRRSRGIRDLFR